MLGRRSIPDVCSSCRARLLLSPTPWSSQPCRRLVTARTARDSANGPVAFSQSITARPRPSPLLRLSGRGHGPVKRRVHTTVGSDVSPPDGPNKRQSPQELEEAVRQARVRYGDFLPKSILNEDEYKVYERLYGVPFFVDEAQSLVADDETAEGVGGVNGDESSGGGYTLWREGIDGNMEEVELSGQHDQGLEDEEEDGGLNWSAAQTRNLGQRQESVEDEEDQAVDDVYEDDEGDEADEVEFADEDDGANFARTHPLTLAGRFATYPSTTPLPKDTLIKRVEELLADRNKKHLADVAHTVFGGIGLPYSAGTPASGKRLQQKPIALDPSQGQMAPVEADAYMAAVMPGVYASVKATLVEVRRRLGSPWIERLLAKEGGPVVLDAGSAGVGVLALREILTADWERIQEAAGTVDGAGAPPLGKATVLTGSDTLRHRASRLLDSTTFIPRLPDTIRPDIMDPEHEGESAPRKVYDIIIAPHTLWGLKDEFQRKQHVNRFWSLLNPDGGVLLLIEKGVPRGFEVIAGARDLLLRRYISSPQNTHLETRMDDVTTTERFVEKEAGMIIAPCTNHDGCPMYTKPGITKGRSDFCHFSQRYVRPSYLMHILGAKGRNHEDVHFSYLAVQRGRDQRRAELTEGVVAQQGSEGSDAAFAGYEKGGAENQSVNPLSLPRNILPPLKRRGHVIMDLCTPAGKLERWTVPRSFSRQAYKDARHASWGDLWALGAKTRIDRKVRLGKGRDAEPKRGKNVVEIGVNINTGYVDPEDMTLKTNKRKFKPRKGRDGRKGRSEKRVTLEDD